METIRIIPVKYKHRELVNLDAPIIPQKSIGGLQIKTKLSDLAGWISYSQYYENPENLEFRMLGGLFAVYSVYEGAVTFVVYIPTGDLCRINAGRGYRGKLFSTISIGSSFRDLLKVDSSWIFYQGVDYAISTKNPGLVISLPEEFEDIDVAYPSLLPDFQIEEISIVDRHFG